MSTSTLARLIRPARRTFSSTAILASSSGTASHAYHIPHIPTAGAGPSRPPPPPQPTRATTEKPILTAEEQQVIDRIVRVDQAGELGANWIYRGQKMAMSLRGDRKAVKQIEVGHHHHPILN
jgi:ubiquinone biosynthesis monooxygenase Coq7